MVIGVHFAIEITEFFFLPTLFLTSAVGPSELRKTG
jgi:hypothetical protein